MWGVVPDRLQWNVQRAVRGFVCTPLSKSHSTAASAPESGKFHLANVIPVDGKAPDILESLEPPTHVFIGGSSGCLADILHVIWEKNPRTRVVVNAISLETVAQITELAAGKMQTEIIQVQVSRAKTVGTYHLMQAENPVYICVLTMA